MTHNDRLEDVTLDYRSEMLQQTNSRSAHSFSSEALLPRPKPRQRRNLKSKELELNLRKGDIKPLVDLLSDDELPEDYVVFNVPVSSSLKSLSNNEHLIVNHPNFLPQAETTPYSSRNSSLFSKSSLATVDSELLSDEAKKLTLEFNTEADTLAREQHLQRRSMLLKFSRPKSEGNPEKLKHISITRPSSLPPKDKYESYRHTRDYQDMVEKALKRESAREIERISKNRKTLKAQRENLYAWRNIVIPDFREKIKLSSTRELWWQGIPAELRGEIWSTQIGDFLNVADKVDTLIQESKIACEMTRIIQHSLAKVYPHLCMFQEGPLCQDLVTVIRSFFIFQKGNFSLLDFANIEFLAATILYYVKDVRQSIIILVNLMGRKLFSLLARDPQCEYISDQCSSFEKALYKTDVSIYNHFKIIDLKPIEYLSPLCGTILSGYFPVNISARLLDVYCFEGDFFLLRSILGMFRQIHYKLFGSKEEVLKLLGSSCLNVLNGDNKEDSGELMGFKYLDVGHEEEFVKCIRDILRA